MPDTVRLMKALRLLNELRKQAPEMTPNEAVILLSIARRPSASQMDIRAETGLSRAVVSRHVDHLSRKGGRGFVMVRVSPMDRRSDWLVLTAAGEAFVEKLTGFL